MKLLMTADPIGGVWTYALELCAGLGRHGVQVMLATLGLPPSPSQRRRVMSIPNVTLRTSRYKLEWMQDPWADLDEAGRWLLELEREFHPDVVHLNHLVHADLPWRAPTLVVGHSCVSSWWAAVKGSTLPDEWSTYRERVTRSLRAARRVVAPTRTMLDALQLHYGPLARAQVILNARTPNRFRPAEKENIVLAAGRLWDPAKNVDALTAVAPSVQWPIYVAGAAAGPAGDAARLSGLRLLGRLPQEELAQWYGRAGIYALPARYEPFGLTVLEAALSGCALVLGDIPSLREVWGDAACYVSPEDHDALRDTLNELAADGERRTALAARATSRARQYGPADFVRAYLLAYRALVEEALTAGEEMPSRAASLPFAGSSAATH